MSVNLNVQKLENWNALLNQIKPASPNSSDTHKYLCRAITSDKKNDYKVLTKEEMLQEQASGKCQKLKFSEICSISKSLLDPLKASQQTYLKELKDSLRNGSQENSVEYKARINTVLEKFIKFNNLKSTLSLIDDHARFKYEKGYNENLLGKIKYFFWKYFSDPSIILKEIKLEIEGIIGSNVDKNNLIQVIREQIDKNVTNIRQILTAGIEANGYKQNYNWIYEGLPDGQSNLNITQLEQLISKFHPSNVQLPKNWQDKASVKAKLSDPIEKIIVLKQLLAKVEKKDYSKISWQKIA